MGFELATESKLWEWGSFRMRKALYSLPSGIHYVTYYNTQNLERHVDQRKTKKSHNASFV